MASTDIQLPSWARVSPARASHIARVTALLTTWADAMHVPAEERRAWRDAGSWHDALRDAPEAELRPLVNDPDTPASLLHGPAAAARLSADGEQRSSVLDAVRFHTTGSAAWDRTGRALYMADYLEPGRTFAASRRAMLARAAVNDFDAVFREVVAERLSSAISSGHAIHPRTIALWNSLL